MHNSSRKIRFKISDFNVVLFLLVGVMAASTLRVLSQASDHANDLTIPSKGLYGNRKLAAGSSVLKSTTAMNPIYVPPPPSNKLWEDSDLIPDWLKEYFEWHQQERQRLTESNWQEGRYLIPAAPKKITSGGMTDRIRPISAILRMAAETKRLLLIRWEKPCALEEFLLPPKGGLDWRVPDFMEEVVMRFGPPFGKHTRNWTEVEELAHGETTYVSFQYQSWHYGEQWYEQHSQEGETPIAQAFRDIWPVVFTPSPPVAQRIHDNFDRMGLVQGEYVTVHIRNHYGQKGRMKGHTTKIAQNAMNCGSHLRPGGPFFVASDSSDALRAAVEYGEANNVTVITANHTKEPLHLDLYKAENVTAADFYDGFVDMYLMAFTRCVAVGPGGFARWGHLLGYNSTCAIHHSGRKSQDCEWKAALEPGEEMMGYESEQERLRLQALSPELPRFHEPMLRAVDLAVTAQNAIA